MTGGYGDADMGQPLEVTVDDELVQVIPGPERIVRELAAVDDPSDYDTYVCGLCGQRTWDANSPDDQDRQSQHDPSCPWRLAKEWVATNPA